MRSIGRGFVWARAGSSARTARRSRPWFLGWRRCRAVTRGVYMNSQVLGAISLVRLCAARRADRNHDRSAVAVLCSTRHLLHFHDAPTSIRPDRARSGRGRVEFYRALRGARLAEWRCSGCGRRRGLRQVCQRVLASRWWGFMLAEPQARPCGGRRDPAVRCDVLARLASICGGRSTAALQRCSHRSRVAADTARRLAIRSRVGCEMAKIGMATRDRSRDARLAAERGPWCGGAPRPRPPLRRNARARHILLMLGGASP